MLMSVIDNEVRTCPGSEDPCLTDGCAMYVPGYGCRFAVIPSGFRPLPTEGKHCPLFQRAARSCGDWCAFFRDGGCAQNAVKVSKRRTTKTMEG